MRKVFLIGLLLGLCACSKWEVDEKYDYVIWDVSPINFTIMVDDKYGNDLLDTTCVEDIIYDISIEYDDSTYVFNPAKSRYYMPSFNGMTYRYNEYLKRGVIYFGEFDGAENCSRDIIIKWHDGTEDTLSYYNYCDQSGSELEITRKYYVNGVEVSGNFVFIKDKKDEE